MRSSALGSCALVLTLLTAVPAGAQIEFKASHQFPGGKGDIRDEMVQILAREVEKANVGLTIKMFPGASLVKAHEQWNALLKG